MSEVNGDPGEDPWAWLRRADRDAAPDYSSFSVVAAVLPERGEPYTGRLRGSLEASTLVGEVREGLAGDAAGDWFWIIPDDVEPTDGALTALLERVRRDRETAVVGGLLVEPRRRGAGTLVSNWAQTISGSGRIRPLTEPGELYQGQLDPGPALGVPADGMLVRGDVWRFLDGFNPELPRSHRGLDFGWRANLAGYKVIADPAARIVDHSPYGDPAEGLAAGLALVSGNTRPARRWLTSLRLVVVCLLTALGYLLGKDPGRAADELRGLGRWIFGRRLRRSVAERLAALPVTPAARAATAALRPGRWAGVQRWGEQLAARLVEWLQTFVGRGTGVSLDEMTGDDFADAGSGRYRVPIAVSGLAALTVAALAAARTAFGSGSLSGPQLLAAPDSWTQLLDAYLTPVPGSGQVSGAPWTGLAGVFSLVTLGSPEWLVTGTLVLAVPLAWLMAFRLLRQVVADRRLAALGALGYALAPALVGGLNAGAFGLAALAVLLPVLGYSCRLWLAGGEWSWRRAGAVAFWVLLACSLAPSLWLAALVAAVVTALPARRVRAWFQWAVVLVAPLLLLVGPWGATVVRYPGRLLTGIEPQLAPLAAVEPWTVLVGHTLSGSAPLWLSLSFFAVLWLAGVAGAVRRPTTSGRALAGAGLAAVVAIALTALVVEVPPGTWARPQALEWQLALTAALVVAACAGLDGVAGDLQQRELGVWHIASLGLAVVCGLAMLVGAGWWVVAGQTGVTRGPVGAVPAFVANAQQSAVPGRTLALVADGTTVRWALLEGDFARLGDAERGTAFGGSVAAKQLAASVSARLVGDSADDQLLPDLVTLGVSHVTLTGGDSGQRVAINNVPGLGVGTGDAEQYVWPVPGAAIATVTGSTGRVPVGEGSVIEPGPDDRVVSLAEPPDPRWIVEVDGTPLERVDAGEPGMQFALGGRTGMLHYQLAGGTAWEVWLQLAGVALLAVMAAPSVRRRSEPAGPRRLAGGAE